MKRIVIAILLGELINPLIEKRIRAEKNIADVHLISWDRGNSNMLNRPSEDGYEAHYVLYKTEGDPLHRMIPYYNFCKYAKNQLRKIKPDVIHAQNLDMLRIAVWYKEKINKDSHIIYDMADLHTLLIDKQKNVLKRFAQEYLLHEEERCSKYVDILIVTSERFYDIYYKRFYPKEKMLYIPNIPDMKALSTYTKKQKDDTFVIGFIGAVRYKEQMKNLVFAAEKTGIDILFAGIEYEGNEIELFCKNYNNIEWYGKFDFDSEVAALYSRCDAIYSVYDADMQNVRTALPNKLFESIYCEVPIIVAKNTYLEELVNSWGVGLAVNHKSIDDLVFAINQLKDHNDIYNGIVENCRKMKDSINLDRLNKKLIQRIKSIVNCA